MNTTLVTHSAEETEKIGEEFASQLKPGDVVCLYGDLGAGKTTFTKGIAKGLGISSRIISPTFTLIRQHEIENRKDIRMLYHIDLYRLENEHQIDEIGLSEIMQDLHGVTLVEWAERLLTLPDNRIDVRIQVAEDGEHEININKPDQAAFTS